jgi:hypothetical protein
MIGPNRSLVTACITLALSAALVAYAQEGTTVAITAKAMPEKPTVGSYIRYEVDVVAPAGMEVVVAQPSERIGALDIIDFGSEPPAETAGGNVTFRRWWKLVAWSTGAHTIESPAVSYRRAGAELTTVAPVSVTVDVASVLGDTDPTKADIRDIKPPKPIPVDWRPYYAIAGIIVALALLTYLVRLLLARRRRGVETPPPSPAHVIALAALDSLRARRLPEEGAFKEYYSALTDIVRGYLEGRYHVRAPEMTTEEFLVASSRDGRLSAAHRRLLGEFLHESDLVKFARHLPSLADSERAFGAARRFVDETAERPATTVGSGDAIR